MTTCDITDNDGSRYSQRGNHTIDEVEVISNVRMHADRPLVATPGDPDQGQIWRECRSRRSDKQPGVRRMAWLALLIQPSGSNRVLPSQ